MGLGPHPVECDVAAKALLDPDVVAGVKATWLQSLPEDRSQKLEEDFTEAVTRRALPMERLGGKRSWEHWAPRPSRMEGPVKQLALDRAAKKKWADKIISVLAPYHRHFDNMQDIKPGEDKYEDMAKHLLHEAVDQQFTIYRLGQLWRTLHSIPHHFGGFDPTVNQAINRRYEYTRGLLVSSEAKKERRATPPSMEVVMALEKLAGTLPDGSPDGYAASFFRFCIGASVEWWGPMIALSKRRNSLATKGLDLDAPYYQLAEEPRQDPSEAQLPVLASVKDPQEENRADGPVFMATNSRKTGSPPVYRVHWFDRGYRCLGCGWRPKDSKSLVTFYELDWTPDYVFCEKAARAKQPPDCFLRDVVTKDSSSKEPSNGNHSPHGSEPGGLLLHEVGIHGLLATPRSLGAVGTGADLVVEGGLCESEVAGISPADLAYFRPESVLALINSHVIGPSQQPSLCILLGPAAILGRCQADPGTPPELCPDPYKEEVMKIEEHVRLVLARHQVPWLVLFVMGKQGFVTAQDWAGRWDEKELRKEAPKLGFSPGQNGYDEHTCVLTAIRLENAVEQFKLLKKRKLAEVDIHSVEDYKAMIGRGDRQEMRAAYLSKFGTEPEREYEGSDHMLGVMKRVLYRGEFLSGSQLDLNKVVANHPKDGELKFQKRQSKEDEEWIHEESNRVQSEKQWKRVLMIWRTSLLMVVATCTGPSCIHLTKADLDDFYNFLFGDTIMGREPAPSLRVLMTAERKVWRQVALNMAKDETLTISAALKEIQNNSGFWSMEIDEFCFRRHHTVQPKAPEKAVVTNGIETVGTRLYLRFRALEDDARSTKAAIAQVETFSDLCALALSGDLMAIIGGGRKGQAAWGLEDLQVSVLRDTDNDSLLLLRMLLLYHLAMASGPRPPAFLLEHAEDPANQGTSEAQQNCSSWWATAQCKDFAGLTRMKIHCFDQCMLGHGARKPTAVLSNLALDWDGLRCRHPDHPVWWSSSDLARWGWQFNLELATALLAFFSTSGDTDGDRSIASALAPVAARQGQMQVGLAWSLDRGDTHLGDGCHRCPFPWGLSYDVLSGIAQDPGAGLPLATDPNIWPSKQELGNARRDLEPPAPTTADNYPSAEVFEDTIEKTFLEEKLLDMVAGPLSEQEAADLCACSVAELCVGAMAGIQELDKVRTIFDASVIGVNDNIRANTDKKTTVNRWLGYMVNISEGSVWLPEEKMTILRPALSKLAAGELHTRKEITSLLGKLQWVAKAYPQVSSHLQPLYAWEQKLERKCRPGELVRFLATLLLSTLDAGPCVPLRLQHNTPCYGSSDAGEDDGRVAIGGWFSPSLNPAKEEVLWFSMDVLTTPWVQPLLAHTSPKRRIGALELLGTLILFLLAAESLGPSMLDAHLPLTTDNEGNAFSASKRSSKKWPFSALLMELSAQEFHKGVFAQVTHVKRSSNTWADQLTHFDFEGFSPVILDKLLALKSEQ
ncbi:unnamed protein product [Symbiodinium sp. CCMP2592]|nr:unnamed protein product [Symbiodinium sp. CCMP2592]